MSRLLDGFGPDDEADDDEDLLTVENDAEERFLTDFADDEQTDMACDGCGCSNLYPCEGGCIWYRDNLCSRCA